MINLEMKKIGYQHIDEKNGNDCAKNKNQLYASQLLTFIVVGSFSLFYLHVALLLRASNKDLQGLPYPIFRKFSPFVHLKGFLLQTRLICSFWKTHSQTEMESSQIPF